MKVSDSPQRGRQERSSFAMRLAQLSDPAGDQPAAIEPTVRGLAAGDSTRSFWVTGSGKGLYDGPVIRGRQIVRARHCAQ